MNIFHSVLQSLQADTPVVLATIVDHSGSAPRTSGTKMVISTDGAIQGTIGGGLLEARVIAEAPEIIAANQAKIIRFDLSNELAADSTDMICGGRLDVLAEPVAPTEANIRLYRRLLDLLKSGGKPMWGAGYATALPDGTLEGFGRFLATADNTIFGEFPLTPDALDTITSHTRGTRVPVTIPTSSGTLIVERLIDPGTVYLFGAGHVAQKVALLAKMVDFQVVVMDDREAFANRRRFPDASQVRVITSFEEAFDGLDLHEDAFVVIVTRGHLHDKTVLEQALRTRAGYIGMIGSRRKRNAIYLALEKQGVDPVQFKRVYSPIGLDIGAETPEEIAVSIVAEMIAHRARMGTGDKIQHRPTHLKQDVLAK